MKQISLIILTAILNTLICSAQTREGHPYLKGYYNDSILHSKPRVWRAVGTVFGVNMGVWAFDRYALNADFARIGWQSIGHNFKTGFLWDNDQFNTNLFLHPYHGSIYFNAGRTNGLNFWQSIPLAVGGSFMWEMFMENQPPSINDIIATPVGGMIGGEITYRLSSAILDGSAIGIERVGREFLGAVLSPVSAINRLIDGSMWEVKPRQQAGSREFPIYVSLTPGMRFVSEGKSVFKGGLAPYAKLSLTYGDPFDNDNHKPYDYFTVSALINASAKQPVFSQVSATGLLWGKNFETHDQQEMLVGIFQHFNYYDSKTTVRDSDIIPYKLAETASFGVGTIYKLQSRNKRASATVGVHLSGILLGGSLSDYYHAGGRNYNMGSGFSSKIFSLVTLDKVGCFNISAEFYRLFTWKGYPKDIDWGNVDEYYLNAQGDISNTSMMIFSPHFMLRLNNNIGVAFGADFFLRSTTYRDYPTHIYSSYELKLGTTFSF